SPMHECRKWHQCFCFIDVDHEIELMRERSIEVMTHAFAFRAINDTNRPLKPSVFEHSGGFASTAQVEIETFFFQPGKDFFITAMQRLTDSLRFCWPVPVGRGSYPAAAGRKSNVQRLIRIVFTDQLPDIELAPLSHLRSCRIAQMRIVS